MFVDCLEPWTELYFTYMQGTSDPLNVINLIQDMYMYEIVLFFRHNQ